MDPTPKPTLTDAEFRLLTSILRERAGLHFDESTRFLVERRIGRPRGDDSIHALHRIEAADAHEQRQIAPILRDTTSQVGQHVVVPCLGQRRKPLGRFAAIRQDAD